jgi:UDP:flavonoid glycosyltransferase YjiC (YdhE family)
MWASWISISKARLNLADKKTGVVTSLDKLTADHLSTLLDEVLTDSIFRENVGKLQKAIAKANGLSVAADLIEESLGVTKKPGAFQV